MRYAWLKAAGLLFCAILFSVYFPGIKRGPKEICPLDTKASAETQWVMLDIVSKTEQADAHLIRFSDGKIVLLDAGNPSRRLVPVLEACGIYQIDLLLISHAHKDHYQGIPALLQNGISVKEARMNLPVRSVCEGEVPWGCDYDDILSIKRLLETKGTQVRAMEKGEVLYRDPLASLTVLYAYDGIQTPVGETDINDTSVVMRLSHGKFRALFTGDLNAKLGGYLAEHGEDLEADILKVPHHGTESAAPDAFLDKVKAHFALVPAPQALWESQRSERLRHYFEQAKIPVRVNGLHGDVKVSLREDRLRIESRRDSDAMESRSPSYSPKGSRGK